MRIALPRVTAELLLHGAFTLGSSLSHAHLRYSWDMDKAKLTKAGLECSVVAFLAAAVIASISGCDPTDSSGVDAGTVAQVDAPGGPPEQPGMKPVDGTPCSYTTWDCNPSCQESCGASASCTDLCCPETTRTGVFQNGTCGAPPPPTDAGVPDPVCGNGSCESGETGSCSDCSPAPATLVVNNTSSHVISELYVSSCSITSWGPNQLGQNLINSGSAASLTGIAPGCYDLLARNQDASATWTRQGQGFIAGQTFTWTLTN